MKYISKVMLGLLIFAIISCTNKIKNNVQIEKLDEVNTIYFASKRIHEGFYNKDSGVIEYIRVFLAGDSIKVTITHSIEENVETFYLSDKEKLNFFTNPNIFHDDKKIREKSDYYNVSGDCYEFSNEGISHNSIYIKKLCYTRHGKDLLLKEMYLLDGD